MGRDKSQRTKGNVKPASSGRTAGLLFTGDTAGGFGATGFTGSSTSGTPKPTFDSLAGSATFVPILDDTLDPKFALPLRKLGKKDPTTKIKALTELITLCTSDPSTPTLILPYYPTIYNKLSTDESKKVRELAQSLLQSIGTSVGRTLATQLKQLLPSWYLGQADTFPPAASLALSSFQLIFPTEEKQMQALKFALTEICALVKERLFSKQEFDKITGLEGLKKLLPLVEGDYIFSILKDDQFWTLVKDDCSQIRGSFYSLLSSLGEIHSSLIPKSKLTQALTKALKEEKFELTLLWNCFLTLTMSGVFNEKETARKELLVLCRNSFYGNSTQLGQLVLPLIHKIGEVGEEIFEALEEGFNSASSNSEKSAIIRTYAETLAYFLKDESSTLPKCVLPFLTKNLKQASEFGRTFSLLLKSNSTFYQALIDFCNEDVIQSKDFGYFVLSFLKGKKSVRFESDEDSDSDSLNINYVNLPDNKKQFAQNISKKILQFKGYKSFSVLSRTLKCVEFFEDVLEHDLTQIPNVFDFNSIEEDCRIEALRISLDLIQTFPELPTSLLLFSTLYDSYFNNVESLDSFIEELDGFDDLKPIKNWFKMDLFARKDSLSVLRYVLRKGTPTFHQDILQEKITQLCSSFNIDIVRDLLNSSARTTNLTEVYEKAIDLYLVERTEEFEQLCLLIVEKDVLSKKTIYDKVMDQGLLNCATLEQINYLMDHFVLKFIDCEHFTVNDIDLDIDSDLLVFHGFKYPKLEHSASLTSPTFNFDPLNLIKKVVFESKLGLALNMKQEETVQIGLNLIFAQCFYNIWEESLGKNFWTPTTTTQFLEELTTHQSKVVELIATDKTTHKLFFTQLKSNMKNHIWASKYPLKYFLQLAKKMELVFPLEPPTETQLEAAVGGHIEWIFDFYFIDPNIDGHELIQLLEIERKDKPEQFQFEKLLAYIDDKQRLFDLLHLTTELMRRNPNNNNFLSNSTCWISAWIRSSKNIQHTKSNYLWIMLLCRAVILIDELVKETKSEFVQEYIEFHAGNLYPNIYSWSGQLLESNTPDYWRLRCCEVVVSALALTPKSIFSHSIEQDSNVIFDKFMPVLKKKEIGFKMSAYKIMRKVVVKDDVIIPRELLNYLETWTDDGDDIQNNEAIVSYLLAWDILLTSQPNTADLANFVKDENLLPKLLSLIFLKLIPQHPKQYFEAEFKLTPNKVPSMPHLTCYILHHVLSCLPYTVRWWWNGLLKQRDRVHVEKIITKYLSGRLSAEELGKVKLQDASENVTVMSHPGCNELVARYKFEETSVTLTISLPLNYPLGPVSVQVSDPKLHARIAQLLNSRSHSLSAGLQLWKESLDDTYKDVDECTICFYVIHHATKQLPKLECRTCRKRFHAACLYKWFSTSNKSECPLCKSLW